MTFYRGKKYERKSLVSGIEVEGISRLVKNFQVGEFPDSFPCWGMSTMSTSLLAQSEVLVKLYSLSYVDANKFLGNGPTYNIDIKLG